MGCPVSAPTGQPAEATVGICPTEPDGTVTIDVGDHLMSMPWREAIALACNLLHMSRHAAGLAGVSPEEYGVHRLAGLEREYRCGGAR